ncbi:uncharacterized protein DUF1320 [Mangrovibacterium marinum]|uniref:Uncharacterized protein DUF1320 n=1 Tax=Mangrovibacterium marinum TaxID=1639118 RepID=A0A2T5C0K5_9BACT|nr:DUF1320 family protein [Mangrovibacterium marinum]PTN08053.1 uncharacterized protein DUF1320 [Mangrovibacterium marinum]
MIFLTDTDFKGLLAPIVLAKLRGTNDENLNESEKLAVSELDPLRGKFNMDAELSKSGVTRNRTLVRIMANITAYYVYNTVVDDEIPERIVANWKKELATIEKIASGKLNSTLLTLEDADGKSATVFRWGSNAKRSHQLYPRSYPDEGTV